MAYAAYVLWGVIGALRVFIGFNVVKVFFWFLVFPFLGFFIFMMVNLRYFGLNPWTSLSSLCNTDFFSLVF